MEFQLAVFENRRPFCETSVLNTNILMHCIRKCHLTYLVLIKLLTSWYAKTPLQILQSVTVLKHKISNANFHMRVAFSVLDQKC